ncbi:MAG: glycosyltransferase family 4 protein [Candidatus Margulisbacteria bacterium]|nr:glycosyltransferase family 4 protein [Candidatus Margulisiibacteriota bacterium]
MIKVLHVSQAREYSGAEIVLANILRHNSFWQASVIVPEGPFSELLNKLGVCTIEAKYLSNIKRKKNFFWPVIFLFKFVLASLEVMRAVKSYKPDIIYANHLSAAPYCLLAKLIYRKRFIWHMHDIHKAGSLESFSASFISKFSDKIIAISDAVKKALIKSGINPGKIVRCYNGIDKKDCFTDTFDEQIKIIKEKEIINIAQIGLLEPRKGVDIFIKAANILLTEIKSKQRIRFYIVGETIAHPEYVEEIKNLVKNLKLEENIIFTGRLKNMKYVYQNIDIAVQASRTPEPFGMVVLEAMVMGALAVGTNIGAIPEIIDDGKTGLLFSPDDPQDLSNKLSAIINREIDVQQILKNAEQKAINQFSLDKQKQCLYETIKSVVT